MTPKELQKRSELLAATAQRVRHAAALSTFIQKLAAADGAEVGVNAVRDSGVAHLVVWLRLFAGPKGLGDEITYAEKEAIQSLTSLPDAIRPLVAGIKEALLDAIDAEVDAAAKELALAEKG